MTTSPSGRKRREYIVTLAAEVDDEHPDGERVLTVEVRGGDQLRGELEAGKNGLPDAAKAPLNQVSVWVWCALVRAHGYEESYQTFRNRDLIDFTSAEELKAKGDGDPEEEVGADPTRPADRSTSGSPSPATSAAAPASGSPQTSPTSTPTG